MSTNIILVSKFIDGLLQGQQCHTLMSVPVTGLIATTKWQLHSQNCSDFSNHVFFIEIVILNLKNNYMVDSMK
jgi:hypothetical protein